MRSTGASRRDHLPLAPLLHAYRARGAPSLAALHQLPGLGPRFAAVLGASARFLYADFLDRASEEAFRDAILRFHDAVVERPLHAETLGRRAGFVRHGLNHLIRGGDPMPEKLDACLSPGGAYRVPGLGPAFWSALAQGLAPGRFPAWTAATAAGVERLGLAAAPGARPADVYAALLRAHDRLRAVDPTLNTLHFDHFLSLVARMQGRDLFGGDPGDPVEHAAKRLRGATPLRQRLKERGQEIADGQRKLEVALASRDSRMLGNALALADPAAAARGGLDGERHAEPLLDLAERLWRAEDPYPDLAEFWRGEPVPGAGLWLPAAVLHLRDPQRYLPFGDPVRQGLAAVDDGLDPGDAPAERYRLANEAAAWLRGRHALHPLETPNVLAALCETPPPRGDGFGGFCADTFAFLADLARENRRAWMDQARERYQWAVRQPLAELCRALASRHVEPVLGGVHGWKLDTASRTGRALTSICKNNYGRSAPYTSTVWITFCKSGRDGAQLFVRLDPDGLRCGLRLGRAAAADRARLRGNVERHGDTLLSLLRDRGALSLCPFDGEDGLRAWARGQGQEASRAFAVGDPVLASEELVGRVAAVFDQLVPLYAACVEDDAAEALTRLGGEVRRDGYQEADFRRQTFLDDDWLSRARDLLSLKKQLILQGVPGTGKTHVARCLARLLTGGHDEAVRLVQFHPAYSYEEFVEGIRVRSVSVEGRHDVTYPVEDGLLCAFAARAAAKASQPHVLIVDEINRGNLPRVFGELLYLLEYRGCAVELPYSRRDFRLPPNLYLIATMNVADRSLALVDQALRRRFSFLQMEPDAAVLAAWLRAHPPAGGAAFASRVVGLFERLNGRLAAEAGPHARVGHSFFMQPDLDEARLRVVWQHHVRPWLDEVHAGQPGRAAAYDALLDARARRAEALSQP